MVPSADELAQRLPPVSQRLLRCAITYIRWGGRFVDLLRHNNNRVASPDERTEQLQRRKG